MKLLILIFLTAGLLGLEEYTSFKIEDIEYYLTTENFEKGLNVKYQFTYWFAFSRFIFLL